MDKASTLALLFFSGYVVAAVGFMMAGMCDARRGRRIGLALLALGLLIASPVMYWMGCKIVTAFVEGWRYVL